MVLENNLRLVPDSKSEKVMKNFEYQGHIKKCILKLLFNFCDSDPLVKKVEAVAWPRAL